LEIGKPKANLFRFFLFVVFCTNLAFAQRLPNEHYFAGVIVKGKPYLFIKDAATVRSVQNLLLEAQIIRQQQLNSTVSEPVLEVNKPHTFQNLMLATGNYARVKYYTRYFTHYPLMKELKSLEYIVPMPGHPIILQSYSKDNSGYVSEVMVDSIFYNLEGELLITCSMISEKDSLAILSNERSMLRIIASTRRSKFEGLSLNQDIPAVIENKSRKLAQVLNKVFEKKKYSRSSETTVQPFMFTERVRGSRKPVTRTLYAISVSSCCYERTSRGFVSILDENGEELWRSELGYYYEEVFVTDVNSDGKSELIFTPLKGDFFFELMIPDRDFHTGRFIMRKVLDHRLPLDFDSGC